MTCAGLRDARPFHRGTAAESERCTVDQGRRAAQQSYTPHFLRPCSCSPPKPDLTLVLVLVRSSPRLLPVALRMTSRSSCLPRLPSCLRPCLCFASLPSLWRNSPLPGHARASTRVSCPLPCITFPLSSRSFSLTYKYAVISILVKILFDSHFTLSPFGYHPISFLPITTKCLKKIVFISCFFLYPFQSVVCSPSSLPCLLSSFSQFPPSLLDTLLNLFQSGFRVSHPILHHTVLVRVH